MRYPIFLLLILMSVFHFSCKKKIHGCLDPNALNYNDQANSDAGNCVYKEDIYDVIIKEDLTWNYPPVNGPIYTPAVINVDVPGLTAAVIAEGHTEVYVKRVTNSNWIELSNTGYWSSDTNCDEVTIDFESNPGQITISAFELNCFIYQGTLPNIDVKIVLLKE